MSLIHSSSSHLFDWLAMTFIVVLCINAIHCRYTDDLERTVSKGAFLSDQSSPVSGQPLRAYGSIRKEDIIALIREALKTYPDRRSSFHAMRGKRHAMLF